MSEPWRATAADYLQRQLDADDPQYADLLPPEPDILTTVREHRPVASRLEMGPLAGRRLIEHYRAAGNLKSPTDGWSTVWPDVLFGVPIVETDRLGLLGWRLLDGDGNVIEEGTL